MSKLSAEQHFFNNIANKEEYDLFAESFYEKIINNTLRTLRRQSIIIDIGSGSGAWGGRVARKGYLVAGTDISKGMLLNGRKSFSDDDLFAVCCDASHLPFKKGAADCVFFGFSLHHMPDILTTLREAYGCLKPDGLLVLVEPNGSNPIRKIGSVAGKILNRTNLYSFSSPVERSLNIRSICKLLKACAFRKISISMDRTVVKDAKSSIIVKVRDYFLDFLAEGYLNSSTAVNFVIVSKIHN